MIGTNIPHQSNHPLFYCTTVAGSGSRNTSMYRGLTTEIAAMDGQAATVIDVSKHNEIF